MNDIRLKERICTNVLWKLLWSLGAEKDVMADAF